jgi:methionyl-tRNA formyltransferase
MDTLRQWPADLFVVAAFGQILPQAVLDLPRYGSLNIHASLLPRWRGAAPIQAAIRAGDAQTGITIMRMDAGLDTGPILTQRALPLAPEETGATLHDKLAVLGGDLLLDTLPGYLDGTLTPQPQDDALATFAPRIRKEEGHIDWSLPAQALDRTVRAFTPWPGTFSFWDGKLLRIVAGSPARGASAHFTPGTVISTNGAPAIVTGDGLYVPTRLQLEGRTVATATEFVNGYPQFVGAVLR